MIDEENEKKRPNVTQLERYKRFEIEVSSRLAHMGGDGMIFLVNSSWNL